jgi:hypothetical protein
LNERPESDGPNAFKNSDGVTVGEYDADKGVWQDFATKMSNSTILHSQLSTSTWRRLFASAQSRFHREGGRDHSCMRRFCIES